jgi:adenosine kinase
MGILVSGSLAYDRISVFKGRFRDHILSGHVHNINLSFNVEEMMVNYGGTGGNIAYSLSLLGEKPILLATLGSDGEAYLEYLKKHQVNVSCTKVLRGIQTASATIMTDLDDNQIASFYMGAMQRAHQLKLSGVKEEISLAIISPNDTKAMGEVADYCFEKEIPFIADPGQSIPALSQKELRDLITGAHILIVNDYEWKLVQKKCGWELKDVLKRINYLIVTYGNQGSKIWSQDATVTEIPARKPSKVVDPTGSGDAYRAGLLYGLKHDYSVEQSACIGAWLAAKCVEKQGTQNHRVKQTDFRKFLKSL